MKLEFKLILLKQHPFGMLMPGRSYSSPAYRYGFNGKEKVDEIDGNGNNLDFGSRIYNSRLGRWLNPDPMKQKYPFFSAYVAFANNPNFYTDPSGDTLRVGGNIFQAKKDVLSFVPLEYSNKIRFEQRILNYSYSELEGKPKIQITLSDYKVIFNMSKDEVNNTGDPGVIALYEMTNCDKDMYYGVQSKVRVADVMGAEGNIADMKDGVVAAKSTPRAFDALTGEAKGYISIDGFDGLRTIAEGEWTENGGNIKSRTSMVFHELYEMYEEVVNNQYYNQNGLAPHGNFNSTKLSLNTTGSHNLSVQAEKNLKNSDSRKSASPGQVETFTPSK